MFALFNPPKGTLKSRYSFFKPSRAASSSLYSETSFAKSKRKYNGRGGAKGKKRKAAGLYSPPKFLRKIGLNSSRAKVAEEALSKKIRREVEAAASLEDVSKMSPPEYKNFGSAFYLKNIAGVVPIFLGAVSTSWLTQALSGKIPYTSKGPGKYVLSTVLAGLNGALGGFVNKNYAKSTLLGGMVEVLGSIYRDFQSGGVQNVIGLGDYLGHHGTGGSVFINPIDTDFAPPAQGLGDFITPTNIENSSPMGSTTSQYSLPGTVGMDQHAQDSHDKQQYEESILGDMTAPTDAGF
jgi:hypothetical protein